MTYESRHVSTRLYETAADFDVKRHGKVVVLSTETDHAVRELEMSPAQARQLAAALMRAAREG